MGEFGKLSKISCKCEICVLKYLRFYTWFIRDIPQRFTQYGTNKNIGGNLYVIKERKASNYERVCTF